MFSCFKYIRWHVDGDLHVVRQCSCVLCLCQYSSVPVSNRTVPPVTFTNSTHTLSMSVRPNFFFRNLFCKFDSSFRILLGTFYWELGRVSASYSFRVPTPTGVAKRYRLLLMRRLHKAWDLMTFKSLKIWSLFLNLLPHPPLASSLVFLLSIFFLPHIPKTIFCALYADFLLFSNFSVPSFLSFPGNLPHYPHVIQHSVFAIFWPSYVWVAKLQTE